MKETVTVNETAKRLGVNPQTVRIGLRRGLFPFGYAVKNSTGSGWRYIIPKAKLDSFLGVKGYETNSDSSDCSVSVLSVPD